ncbi:MAG: DDE-type integrase/transposase/recombinase [Planctomycetota bacterium]
MILQSYRFQVIHKAGKDNIADCFSRLLNPPEKTPSAMPTDDIDHYINLVTTNAIPRTLSLELVRNESIVDPELDSVRHSMKNKVWSTPLSRPYKEIKEELTENDGIILKGTKIILPQSLRKCAINIAHQGHLGISKTVGLLRTKVFWPNLHKDVTNTIRPCIACQAVTASTHPEPLKPSPLPTAPWCEISADFHGPLPSGEKLLVILDEYSRFPIVHVMRTTTADAVINKLDGTFSLFGLPDELKADNGPPFDSHKLSDYLKECSIHHRRITPLHPQSNAKCERFMKVIGKTLKTAQIEGKNWRKELDKLLSNYRNSPHTSTGFSPALLFFNRTIKTGLPEISGPIRNNLHNAVRENDSKSQQKLVKDFNNTNKPKESTITVGDKILLKQSRKNQLSSYYDPEPYTVTHKHGSAITVTNGNHSFTRDLSHAKKLLPERQDKAPRIEQQQLTDEKKPRIEQQQPADTKHFKTEI